jgi:hypothetical protein
MTDENGVVIHAEDQFDAYPRDPDVVALEAADALRKAVTMAKQIDHIEAGETDWQRGISAQVGRIEAAVKRIELNLSALIEHCRGRTVASNQSASTPPAPMRDGIQCFEGK